MGQPSPARVELAPGKSPGLVPQPAARDLHGQELLAPATGTTAFGHHRRAMLYPKAAVASASAAAIVNACENPDIRSA